MIFSCHTYPLDILRILRVVNLVSFSNLLCIGVSLRITAVDYHPTGSRLIIADRIVKQQGRDPSRREYLLQAIREERQVGECAESAEALTEYSPFALVRIVLMPDESLADGLAVAN